MMCVHDFYSCQYQIKSSYPVLTLEFHSKNIYFFFQAEDGIRDYKVTGVQMCALPIYLFGRLRARKADLRGPGLAGVLVLGGNLQDPIRVDLEGDRDLQLPAWLGGEFVEHQDPDQIGRASCSERGTSSGRSSRGQRKRS